MSIRAEMFSRFANSADNFLQSGANLANSVVSYEGKKKQVTASNQFNLSTAYQEGLKDVMKNLPESVDFDSYDQRIQEYNNSFVSDVRGRGIYDEKSLEWLENTFIPSQKAQTEASVGEIQNYAANNWLATQANGYAQVLAANPDISEYTAYKKYEEYYQRVGLGKIENGSNAYGIMTPEEFHNAVKAPKAEQIFEKLARDPENGYLSSSSFDRTAAINKAKSEAKYSPDATQNPAFEKQCDTVLKKIYTERKEAAASAQEEITSKYMAKYLNREDYSAQDVIEDAVASGALRADGTVDRFWVTFLTPYIEYAVKEETLAEETAKAQAELDAIGEKSEEDILGVLKAVNDGTYEFSPQVGETPEVKGVNTKIPMSSGSASAGAEPSASEGAPAVNLEIADNISTDAQGNLVFDGQQTQVRTFRSNTGDVWAYSQTEIPGLEQYIFTDNRADGRGITYRLEQGTESPAFEKDYTPEKGSGNRLSDELAAKAISTEGTEFSGAFTSDFELTSSRLQGKHKYTCEGMEDLTIEYEPAVIALCESWGIAYDDKSPQTYKVAQMVQNLADSGAFSNPNKAVAVQYLANIRLNPNVTPDEYNTQLMQYKTTGVLTDQEIKDYNLEKSAFAGDFAASGVKDYLSLAYSSAFNNTFGLELSDKNQKKLTPEQLNTWFTLRNQIEQELTRAVQMNPQKAKSNPYELMNEVVDTLTSKAFSDALFSSLTKMASRPNVTAFDVRNFKGPTSIGGIFNPSSYQMGIVTARRMDETETGSEILSQYYSSMFDDEPSKYQGMLNRDVVEFYNNAQTATTKDSYYTSKTDAEKQIEDLAVNVYKTDYKNLTISQKNELLFSYLVARSQMELKKSACNTFGYEMNDAYGNIVVAPSGGYGGGAAVVTKDGRVFMSGGDPDNNGHKWMIGSVSSGTLDNIRNGVSVISFEEISENGFMVFSDDNLQYTKEGVNLNRTNMKERNDKTVELVGIYESVQPGRYNIRRSM